MSKVSNGASPEYNLDAMLAQRNEARGGDAKRAYFSFAGKTWSFRDHQFMTDTDKMELDEISSVSGFNDIDLAAWYMGEEQYDEFVQAGGNSSAFLLVFSEHRAKVTSELSSGKGSTYSRYSRRHPRS